MKDKLFRMLNSTISRKRIQENAEEIHHLEGNASYSNYGKSTDYVIRMLKESGFEQIERIALPSDGKTAYFDCIMPQAWETTGRSFLRLEDTGMTMEERMIADSDRDPFNIGIWSAPTPKGGIDGEIVDFRQTGSSEKAIRGKLVLMDGFSQDQYKFLALHGALAVIISDSKAVEDYPDYCRWCNAIGYTGWYSTAEDKRIPVFSISPRRCLFLRNRLAQGKLTAHAEAECRIYDGEIYSVTGVIPGQSAEEITMLAHMYEPFLPDDATGGAIIAEICRCLKKLISQKKIPPLKKSLRIVLSMERYGYSHYFSDRKKHEQTLMVFSFDSCCHLLTGERRELNVRLSSMLQPTFLDLYLPDLMRRELPGRYFSTEKGTLSDDTFCSDDEIGIPSMWIHTFNPRYHHNSGPAFMKADWSLACDVASLLGTLIGKLATGNRVTFGTMLRQCEKLACSAMTEQCIIIKKELEEGKLTRREAKEKTLYYAGKLIRQLNSVGRFCPSMVSKDTVRKIRSLTSASVRKIHAPTGECELFGIQAISNHTVITRMRPGLLMSLVHVPQPKRHTVNIPDLLYALFDGKRTVYQAVKLYEYEMNERFSDQQFSSLMDELRYLEEYGYVASAVKEQ